MKTTTCADCQAPFGDVFAHACPAPCPLCFTGGGKNYVHECPPGSGKLGNAWAGRTYYEHKRALQPKPPAKPDAFTEAMKTAEKAAESMTRGRVFALFMAGAGIAELARMFCIPEKEIEAALRIHVARRERKARR